MQKGAVEVYMVSSLEHLLNVHFGIEDVGIAGMRLTCWSWSSLPMLMISSLEGLQMIRLLS